MKSLPSLIGVCVPSSPVIGVCGPSSPPMNWSVVHSIGVWLTSKKAQRKQSAGPFRWFVFVKVASHQIKSH